MDTGYVNADGDVVDIQVINQSGLASSDLDPMIRELSGKLTAWTEEMRGGRRKSGLFDRAKFVTPNNPYDQMRTARAAVTDDDIVSAAADVTEGLIFQELRWESTNEDVADIFNQINADLDLDTYVRTVYRELFTYSQSVTATWWGRQSFTPRTRSVQVDATGKTKRGPVKRKAVSLLVPQRIVTLDPLKVVPVNLSVFGQERLAWNATADESEYYDTIGTYSANRIVADPVMEELFDGRYTPSLNEEAELAAIGVNPQTLLRFRTDRVWRHSATKPSYDRFPDIRLRSVFRLLDLKQQLMESDRVTLVGSANYILLVKKGDRDLPGTPEEIANLREGFKVLAKLPVIVSDHRLNIEIITPDVNYTLDPERYELLDRRIIARVFGMPAIDRMFEGQSTTRMIARNLENRRHMLRRAVEKHILTAIWDNPANAEALAEFKPDEKPSLAFNPRNVQIDNDAQMMQLIQTARQSEELSRQTFLDFLGIDQDVEARRRQREVELYPEWQQKVPFNSPANGNGDASGGEPPAVAGTRGGRPLGGGDSPQSGQGRVKPRTSTGAPSTTS